MRCCEAGEILVGFYRLREILVEFCDTHLCVVSSRFISEKDGGIFCHVDSERMVIAYDHAEWDSDSFLPVSARDPYRYSVRSTGADEFIIDTDMFNSVMVQFAHDAVFCVHNAKPDISEGSLCSLVSVG